MKKYVRIKTTGSYLPNKIMTNHDIEKLCDTTDEWIVSRTGIRTRHCISGEESTSRMALWAAERALADAEIDLQTIDLIICASCTTDRTFPSIGCYVQQALGIKDCIAFDVQAACAGFAYGLSIAKDMMSAGTIRHALVIGSESLTRALDWKDRNVSVLFGDGAGAVLLEQSAEPGILSTHLHADGSQKDILYMETQSFRLTPESKSISLQMKGNDVFKYAVTYLGEVAEEALLQNQLTVNDIDWMIPHQANIRIIQTVAKRLQIPWEKVIVTVDKHGNTSAASIPLALDDAVRRGLVKRGQRLLLESFGGGLTWGAILLIY